MFLATSACVKCWISKHCKWFCSALPTNRHALSWGPRAPGTVPRSSQLQREDMQIPKQPVAILRAKCLERGANKMLWRGGSWRLKQKWQMPGACQAKREGEGHPGRGNNMRKGMEPWMHTLHAGRSAWLRHVRWGSREGDEAEEEGDVGSWKGFRFYALSRKEMRGAHFVFKQLTVG